MPYSLGVEEAFDIVEGTVAGGIIGFVMYVIAGAVSLLPGAFLTAAEVTPLSVVVGALAFLGVAVHQIRARNESLKQIEAAVKTA